jgi:hypothetical protein
VTAFVEWDKAHGNTEIRSVTAVATAAFKSGSHDALIDRWLEDEARAARPPLDVSKCPDCKGEGYYYPEGFDKGVRICKHPKLRGSGGADEDDRAQLVLEEVSR